MARLRSADKVVVGKIQPFRKRLPGRGQFVAIRLRFFPAVQRGLLDFLAVFIEAGEKKNILAETAMNPGDHVRDDFFVGMAEVGLAVDVVNGGRQIKAFRHARIYFGGRGAGWQSWRSMGSDLISCLLKRIRTLPTTEPGCPSPPPSARPTARRRCGSSRGGPADAKGDCYRRGRTACPISSGSLPPRPGQ